MPANIRFLAVARVGDGTVVATHAPAGDRSRMEEKVHALLRSSKLSDQRRLTISDPAVGAIHYECDAATLYMAVTAEGYPQRTAFALLGELQGAFEAAHGAKFGSAKEGALSKAAAGLLSGLVRRYEEPGRVDKVTAVGTQVDAVKNMMQANINTVLRNKDNIESLLVETSNLAGEASTFSRTANQVKNDMWWKNAKLVICIIILLALLSAAVFGATYYNKGAKI